MPDVNWEANLKELLKIIGSPNTCDDCGRNIVWVNTKTGTRLSVTLQGVPHVADCPKAAEFRKKKP